MKQIGLLGSAVLDLEMEAVDIMRLKARTGRWTFLVSWDYDSSGKKASDVFV